jgi:hypothetical protein
MIPMSGAIFFHHSIENKHRKLVSPRSSMLNLDAAMSKIDFGPAIRFERTDLLSEQKPGRSNPRWPGLIAGLSVAFGSIAASAMPTAVDYPVDQIKGFYHHSSWTAKDGAPEAIRTMT